MKGMDRAYVNGNKFTEAVCLFVSYLQGQGLWDIVDGSDVRPEGNQPGLNAWKKNGKALHAIQISCGSDMLSYVRELDSAKEAWDSLVIVYEQASGARKSFLEAELRASKQGEYSIAVFSRKVKDIRDQLEGIGIKMENNTRVAIISENLRTEFDAMRVLIQKEKPSMNEAMAGQRENTGRNPAEVTVGEFVVEMGVERRKPRLRHGQRRWLEVGRRDFEGFCRRRWCWWRGGVAGEGDWSWLPGWRPMVELDGGGDVMVAENGPAGGFLFKPSRLGYGQNGVSTVSLLLQEEALLERRKLESKPERYENSNEALFTNARGKPRGKAKFQGSRNPNSNQSRPSTNNGRNFNCYNCGKRGHFARECWHKEGNSSAVEEYEDQPDENRDDNKNEEALCMMEKADLANDQWYIDSACSNHMTPREELFVTKEPFTKVSGVITGDNTTLEIKGQGQVELQESNGGINKLFNVLHVLKLCKNLMSVGQLVDQGYDVNFSGNGCEIYKKKMVT
ncbi:uncharacterized protein LOC143876883 [Tasmannia lanceolata]|uniref:uncharacterized protein LOC143876883 n=1 Tax=Tasmannia lanceolata TaxID=3420 RepID=UPI004062E174